MFLDSDDFLFGNSLETFYHLAKATNADLVISGFCHFIDNVFHFYDLGPEEIRFLSKAELLDKHDESYINSMIFGGSPWGKLYKKNLFEGIRFPLGRYCEDVFTIWKTYLASEKTVYYNVHLYVYRDRNDSITKSLTNFYDLIDGIEDRMKCVSELGYSLDQLKQTYQFNLTILMNGMGDNPEYAEKKTELQMKLSQAQEGIYPFLD